MKKLLRKVNYLTRTGRVNYDEIIFDVLFVSAVTVAVMICISIGDVV